MFNNIFLIGIIGFSSALLGMEQPRYESAEQEHERLTESFFTTMMFGERAFLGSERAAADCIITLLGVDPNKKHSEYGALVASVDDFEKVQFLVRLGADINASTSERYGCETALTRALYERRGDFPLPTRFDNLAAVVWLLMHGANPNLGGLEENTAEADSWLGTALRRSTLPQVVALLRAGAKINVPPTYDTSIPAPKERLTRWQPMMPPLDCTEIGPIYGYDDAARIELLQAVVHGRLNPALTYTTAELEKKGLTHDSAALVEAAMQDIAKHELACAQEEVMYRWGQKRNQDFVLNRPLGLKRNR